MFTTRKEINKKIETPKQRAERKALFIARATKHFDTPRIRKEAAELFEAKNKLHD